MPKPIQIGNGIVDTGIYVPPEFWDICSYALKADLLGAYEAHRMSTLSYIYHFLLVNDGN